MKRILLAGSAAAALMAMVAPASAQFVVSIRGNYQFTAGYVDQQKDTGLRDTAFEQRFRVDFRADGKADNGLEYGARLRLRALNTSGAASFDYDRAYVYAGTHQLGRIQAGTDAGYADPNFNTVWEYDQCQLSGGWDCRGDGGWQDYIGGSNNKLTNSIPFADVVPTLTRTNYPTRVSYFTPTYKGFSAGVSYVPRIDATGTDVNLTNTTGIQDVYDVGATYDNTFPGGFRVRATGDYIGGSNPKVAAGSAATNGYYDVQEYQAALRFDYQGFSVGGGYVNNGKCNGSGTMSTTALEANCQAKPTSATPFKVIDYTTWNANLQYATGPLDKANTLIVGGGFLETRDAGGATVPGSRRLNDFQVAMNYIIAPGFSQVLEYNYFQARSDGTATSTLNDDGSIVLLRTNLVF